MTTNRFTRIILRTSDEPAGRAFYAGVLGVPAGELEAFPLHETAVARGAKPHWLGFLEVAEVKAATAAFVEKGATSMGPPWVNPQGVEGGMTRDAGGAILALAHSPPTLPPSKVDVAWWVLNTADVERAMKTYGELFGWHFEAPAELAGHGVFHPFAWAKGEQPVGAMLDIAGRPGVHPHWLFHLRVAAIGPAVEAVKAGGGTVAAQATLASGTRIAVCDDPQGAAFALWQDAGR